MTLIGSAFAAWVISYEIKNSSIEPLPVADDCYLFETDGATYNGTDAFSPSPKANLTSGMSGDFKITWNGVKLNGTSVKNSDEAYRKYAGTHYFTIKYVKTDGAEYVLANNHSFVVAQAKIDTVTVTPTSTAPLFDGQSASWTIVFSNAQIDAAKSSSTSHTQNVAFNNGNSTVNYSFEPVLDLSAKATSAKNADTTDFWYNYSTEIDESVSKTVTGRDVLGTCYFRKSSANRFYKNLDDALLAIKDETSGTLVAMQSFTYGETVYSASTYGVTKQFTHEITKSVTVPKGVTLTLPYTTSGTSFNGSEIQHKRDNGTSKPTCLNAISISNGVTLTVRGTLDIDGALGITGQANSAGACHGNYGVVKLLETAKIDCYGAITSYGYIIGSRTNDGYASSVNMQDGSELTMPFVVYDYYGGSITTGTYFGSNDDPVSKGEGMAPFNIFDMPNVQTNLVCNYGSKITALASLHTGAVSVAGFEVIKASFNTTSFTMLAAGDGLFNMSSGKATFIYDSAKEFSDSYNPTESSSSTVDIILEGEMVSGSLSMEVSAAGITKTIQFGDLYFPVSGKINLTLRGNYDYTFKSDFKFMPGSKLNIEKGAELIINEGAALIFYDASVINANISLHAVYAKKLTNSGEAASFTVDGGTVTVNGSLGATLGTISSGGTLNLSGSQGLSASSIEGHFESDGAGDLTGENASIAHDVKRVTVSSKIPSGYGDIGNYTEKDTYYSGPRGDDRFAWHPDTILLKFTANGGTASATQLEKECSPSGFLISEGSLPTATRTYYTFDHWCTDSDKNYHDESECNTPSTLYRGYDYHAVWKANDYTVTFNANGGTVNPTSKTVTHAGEYGELPTPQRTGYTFLYWTYGGMEITSSSIMSAGAHELLAVWKANTHTVTFKAEFNGAAVSLTQSSKTVEFGSAYGSLPTSTDDGIRIVGWLLNGVPVDEDTIVSTDSAHTLTAVCEELLNTITVTFELNGGIGDTSGSFSAGVAYQNLPKPTKTGYTFAGWTLEDGTKVYNSSVAGESDHTLYATWTPITYTVVFDKNDGDGTMDGMTFTYDVAKQLTSNSFARTNYRFTGWNTKANGSGTSYSDGASVSNLTATQGETVTLYAQWEAVSYVSFNANGGSGTMSNMTLYANTAQNLTANSFTKTGYTFVGWNTKANGSGTSYSDGASVTSLTSAGEEITLYAQWTPITYTVVFDANGGSGTMNSMTLTYDVEQNLTANSFTRTDYTFNGWKDENGNSYSDKHSVANLASTQGATVTLYAQWQKNSSGGCFAEGTLITMADGTQKRVEDIKLGDMVISWNFFTGEYVTVPVAVTVNHGYMTWEVITLVFDDGTAIRITDTHEFFDVTANAFINVNSQNASGLVGHEFLKMNGETNNAVKLVGYEITYEEIGCYTVLAASTFNVIAEGMITLTPSPIPECEELFRIFDITENMTYDEKQIAELTEKYGLYTYEDFEEYLTYDEFAALNGQYYKILVGQGIITKDDLIEAIKVFVNQ